MGAGMFFCRSRLPQEVFAVRPTYLPDSEAGTEDAYQQTIQWSRRFIGLKVFLTLAELGAEGVARLIDHQASMAQLLRESLAANGWRIVNGSPLPLVCFGRDEISADNIDHIAKAVVAEGIWISVARLPKGEQCLRACITHHHASPDDVQQLVQAVNRAVQPC
jgi:glutamate/tyrosine decarboxylase-like PLP-dependent enzyme